MCATKSEDTQLNSIEKCAQHSNKQYTCCCCCYCCCMVHKKKIKFPLAFVVYRFGCTQYHSFLFLSNRRNELINGFHYYYKIFHIFISADMLNSCTIAYCLPHFFITEANTMQTPNWNIIRTFHRQFLHNFSCESFANRKEGEERGRGEGDDLLAIYLQVIYIRKKHIHIYIFNVVAAFFFFILIIATFQTTSIVFTMCATACALKCGCNCNSICISITVNE